MNKRMFRFRHILVKDLRSTGNRWFMLLGIYGMYFLLAWFALRQVESGLAAFNSLRNLFWPAFLIQTAVVITVMLMPPYVYSESMQDKQETYFAYGYSIIDIVLGKSVMITLAALLPASLFSLICFPGLRPQGAWPVLQFFAVGAAVFGLVGLTVFLVWFSRVGRFTVALLIILMVASCSRFQSFRVLREGISAGGLTLLLSLSGVITFAVFVLLARLGDHEKSILRR